MFVLEHLYQGAEEISRNWMLCNVTLWDGFLSHDEIYMNGRWGGGRNYFFFQLKKKKEIYMNVKC